MRKGFVFIAFLWIASTGLAQQPDTLIKKLDSLSRKTDSAGGQVNNYNPSAYNEATKITLPSYFILLGSDLKQAFTKPFHMDRQDWVSVGKFAAVFGGVALLDETIQRNALNLRNNNVIVRNVSRQVTNFGGLYEAYTLAALGTYGFVFKNEKMKTTTLLATQAYITGAAVESVLKFATGRQRPCVSYPAKFQAEPNFHGPFFKSPPDANGNKMNSSFPSGHTTVAFAAATVFAMEYKDKPFVPILAYSAATLIGVSRMTENRHWATDVLTGAALGYLSGRLVVNNYHRYAKLKAPQQKKNSISFNLQYKNGVVMPGAVYRF